MIKNRGFAIVIIVILMSINVAAQIENSNYRISDDIIIKNVKIGKFEEHVLTIENKGDNPITVMFSSEGNISSYMVPDVTTINLEAKSSADAKILFFADNMGFFNGTLVLSGNVNERIPAMLTVGDISGVPISAISIKVEPLSERVYLKDTLRYKINIHNLLLKDGFNITLHYSIDSMADKKTYLVNKTFLEETENLRLNKSTTLIKFFEVPEFIRPGEYVITARVDYLGISSTASARFLVSEPIWDYLIFGIMPVRWLLLTLSFLAIAALVFLIIRKRLAKKKRYKGKIDFKLLPKPGERSILIGKIAESKVKAYFDMDQLTIHSLIAGSTGGGKTVSAEVLVEEALLKGVAIIVFDPTAQWTGFLRKCTNKKMIALYPSYGLKKTDARAFNGNVHQIMDARQIIDIKKYLIPGEIHVFAINKLDPKDSDILVANTIREVFHADLPESPQLRLIVIFDEVHRLLPKFGGTGQGFIQIERGAREFRKWGVGLVLISQVLTDFIGETKANINTEIQMRTRDEGDLNRIKDKYGSYMLQSLLKSATGTGMISNSAYNRGNPYFVSFRPLLHEHARLTDEELDNYNKYNDIIDDLDDQIEQLREEEVDIFDLKLELKMALDKVKSGSFNMVDIYLEGLKPRLDTAWDKIGKQAKKRKLKLVSEKELQEEFEKAKKEREKFEKEHPEEAKKAAAKQEKKKEQKKLPPLKLKNGVTVSSPQELIDEINTMDEGTYAAHASESENIFADWIMGSDKETAEKLRAAKTKEDTIAVIEDSLYK
ncbi:MAG: DUF87 domain-containing protein [Nanoarchaeota archaeon]